MHLDRGHIRFTPSDLAVFLASEFASWMDRWDLERRRGRAHVLPVPIATPQPVVGEPDADGEDARMLQRRGVEHERAVLASLSRGAECREMQELSDLEATGRALRQKIPVLYQALLRDGELSGRPDFLLLRAAPDGRTWYEPAEAKLARSPKPEHVLQLCAYADLLADIQGVLPPEMEIILGDGRSERLRTDRYIHYARRLRRTFLEFQHGFDPRRMPHPGRSSSHGRWSGCAESIIAATDHVRACAFIHRTHVRKLEQAGITTLARLAEIETSAAPGGGASGIRPAALERLATQARMQVESRLSGRLRYQVRRDTDLGERRGLALLPPESPGDVFFDMEGHPLPDGQLEYLFGAIHEEHGETRFHDVWALCRQQEQAAFEQLVDWLHARWRQDPEMHVYHYNSYEVAALRRLMGLYGSREDEIDHLLRAGAFVDLYRIVRQGLVIGSAGYSLKDIEPLYRPKRDGKVRTAEGCMAAFERWLDVPDGDSWRESSILHDIREYNRADCESTRDLAKWLRGVQQAAGIEPAPAAGTTPATHGETVPASRPRTATEPESDRGAAERERRQALGARLLEIAGAAVDPHERRIAELLAQLLEFHWREAKPVFWKMYERHGMSEDELFEDPESIAGCESVDPPSRLAAGGTPVEYAFEPGQETKLGAGDRCTIAGIERSKVEIVDLDADAGRVRLRFGSLAGPAPRRLSIFLDDFVPDAPLRAANLRHAEAWSDGRRIAPAIDDYLARRAPRIAGHAGGTIVRTDEPLVPALARSIGGLQESTLCIQGPPGTGKTHNAARVILELLERGDRVGITAHGHKAILNLLVAVADQARARGVEARLVKVGGDADDPRLATAGIQLLRNNKDAGAELDRHAGNGSPDGRLPGMAIGGTAWCFARQEMERRLDYLFVDEAGQVSVANLVASALATRNLVLVGDQMQLAQPLQGSHPGESGQSALEYLLRGQATIPPDFGVFLEVTYRMHPDVCGFVSEAVYDGKLHPAESTRERRIVPAPAARGERVRVRRGTGILWVPVEHHDNAQASDEEVDAISEIVRELLRSTYHDGKSPGRKMQLGDILFVAPYNMQVRRLERRLQREFEAAPRVGSVDRFQGLEAPAVIVSMCASTLDDVPRGLQFLLSPNRINVAISRAQALAVVVGSPAILGSRCRSLEDMERLNLYCRLVEHSEHQDSKPGGASR